MSKKDEGYRKMDAAEALYAIEINAERTFLSGLLYPSHESIFAYGKPALAVYAKIDHYNAAGLKLLKESNPDNNYEFFACIHSIDDSGVSIFASRGRQEKANKLFNNFAEFIQKQQFRCPTREELRQFCINNNIYENYW